MSDVVLTGRIRELEEALLLFCALATGQPEDASEVEKAAAQERLGYLLQRMKDRVAA